MEEIKNSSDRDLLISIATQLPYIKRDIKDSKELLDKNITEIKSLMRCNAAEIEILKSWKDKVSGGLILIYAIIGTIIAKIFDLL